jgi:oxalate decarboxylase
VSENRSKSQHTTSLDSGETVFTGDLGSITAVTSGSLPILSGLSMKRLVLQPGAVRELHWHADASELTYCLSGDLLVGILGDDNQFTWFTLGRGQMFYAPSGALHYIENVGESAAELIVTFSNEAPQDFSFRASVGAMSDAVLGNTWGLDASQFANMRHTTEPAWIVRREGPVEIPHEAEFGSPLKFDVEAEEPPIASSAGTARVARSQVWPALSDLAMYSLRIADDGMREPHWHPGTAEMGYVAAGRARMTVLDPDGRTDTYELGRGDVYFIPSAFPHHIENIGGSDFHFLVYFDRPMPADIGYRASGSLGSRAVTAATLGLSMEQLPDLPSTPEDPLIVDRDNPVDPVGPEGRS